MVPRLALILIATLTVCFGIVRFARPTAEPVVDLLFLALALTTLILSVRHWAEILGGIKQHSESHHDGN